jgi:protein SCO1/2
VDKSSSPSLDPTDPAAALLLTFAACLIALVVGFGFVFNATDRGRAFTTENLRRGEVARQPVSIPDFTVFDASGRKQSLRDLLTHGKRAWIVDFVYTRCQSVCSSLGTVYQQLQNEIIARDLQGRVGLLSISFDPANDRPASLRDHALRMRMHPDVWRIVSLDQPQDRRRLLDTFGIMIVPAPLGEFEHNAALHIVDREARLVRIVDTTEPGAALELALSR